MGINQRMNRDIKPTEHCHNENAKPQNPLPTWFWLVIFAGLAVRIYLAIFTEGTYDVGIWQGHAAGIQKYGLLGYYHTNKEMNHPPFISTIISRLPELSQATGIPFRILLRMPFVLIDGGTALLLLLLLGENRYRFVITSGYWLNPLAVLFSAYHGNTDSSVAFFLLLCVYLLSKQRIVWGAIVLGASLWVKLPGILVIPALVFFIPDWRKRFIFLCAVGLTGIAAYLPAILIDPAIICKNVFGYQGQIIQTTAGVPVWGTLFFFPYIWSFSPQWQKVLMPPALFYLRYNVWFCIVPIVLLSWLRRSKQPARELALTITGIYAIVYGFSNYWSFQYFAWSIPFWFFAPVSFAAPATILAGGYIYFLYSYFCGNPWLLGQWDFVGHPYWPEYIEFFRNGALLFFIFSACVFLIGGAFAQIKRLLEHRS